VAKKNTAITEPEQDDVANPELEEGIEPEQDENDPENLDVEDDPNEEVVSEHLDEEEIEDEHASLSSRILRVLLILAIGAGGALWAGPKIAPKLPAGLKPVADFLAPQTDVSAQLATLEASFADRFAEIEANSQPQDLSAEIKPALAQLENADKDLSAKLGSIQKSLSDLQAEMTTLNARQALSAEGGAVSDEAIKQFEEKLAAITSAQQKLNQSQSVAVEAKQDAETTLRIATATSALTQISDALASGRPFQDALDKLSSDADLAVPDALSNIASKGTASLSNLRKELPALARTALRSKTSTDASDTVLSNFTSFLKSQVGSRSLAPQEGDTLNAVLSRIEAALATGDLNAAVIEAAKIADPAKETMAGWTASLSNLTGATNAVQKLQQHLTTLN
jgi:hypothetical protein